MNNKILNSSLEFEDHMHLNDRGKEANTNTSTRNVIQNYSEPALRNSRRQSVENKEKTKKTTSKSQPLVRKDYAKEILKYNIQYF